MRLRKHWMYLLLVISLTLAAAVVLAQSPGKENAGNKSAVIPAPSRADVDKGRKIFDASCAVCHYRTSPAKKIGPGMKGLAKRGAYADGKPVDDASLREWVERGGKNMPGFKDALTAEQIRELIAFLKTL